MQNLISNRRMIQGFTLTEMVITLAVGSVLIGIGLPSIHSFTSSNRMSNYTNQLVAHLALARSEAVMRGKRTMLCPSLDGAECSGSSDWHEGWILFADADGNHRPDRSEDMLRVQGAASDHTRIISSLYRKHIVFQSNGMALGSNATFTFCPASDQAEPRAVVISNTGRTRLSKTKPGGGPLICSN